MNDTKAEHDSKTKDELSQLANKKGDHLLLEFWDFLKHNKKWWLIPILIVLLGVGLIAVMTSGVAAPFIYPLL